MGVSASKVATCSLYSRDTAATHPLTVSALCRPSVTHRDEEDVRWIGGACSEIGPMHGFSSL